VEKEEFKPEVREEYGYEEKYEEEAYGVPIAEYEEEEAPAEEETAIVECPKCGAEIEVPLTGGGGRRGGRGGVLSQKEAV